MQFVFHKQSQGKIAKTTQVTMRMISQMPPTFLGPRQTPSRMQATEKRPSQIPKVQVLQRATVTHGRQLTVTEGTMTTVITMIRQMSLTVSATANHVRQLDESICEVREVVAEVQRSNTARAEGSTSTDDNGSANTKKGKKL